MDYHLRVGETAVVRPRWWGRSWSVIYAGRLAGDTFAFAVQWSMGHNSAAYNVFLGDGEREFRLPPGTVSVRTVSDRGASIRFEADR